MKNKVNRLIAGIVASYQRSATKFGLRITVLVAALFLIVVERNFWTPDTLFLVMLAVAVAFGQTRGFLLRFVPFVVLLLVYDSFRSIADDLNNNVHYMEMVIADRWLFAGALPTIVLQEWWWNGDVRWYDFYFYFLYTIHFLIPVLVAVLVWKFRDKLYWQYVMSFVILSFSAFITYVVFPAAPPWLASDIGLIEPLHRISSDIWYAMGVTNFSEIYDKLSPNQVAAIPSLHSAYPLLAVMFVNKLFGLRKTWWLYIYPVSMWVGVVYLGEHYVIDAILGAMYAVAAYFASARFFIWYNAPANRLKRALYRMLRIIRLA